MDGESELLRDLAERRFGLDPASVQKRRDEAVVAALEAALKARTEWEESPGLYFMEKTDGGYVVRDTTIFDRWPREPTEALPYLADALEETPDFLAAAFRSPNTFVGMAFRCEAWMVVASLDDEKAVRKIQERRELHRHPDRVEQRVLFAVVRGGRMYMVTQRRDTGEIESHASGKLEGRVPDSLARMVAALLPGD